MPHVAAWFRDLAAFAMTAGLRLVTLDKDFRSFEPAGLDLLLLA